MRVPVLGGTGSIGEPLVRELLRASHQVLALTRSAASAGRLTRLDAELLVGDIREPEPRVRRLPAVQGVIHATGTFTDDEARVDRGLPASLLARLGAQRRAPRLLSTGGCWLRSERCGRTHRGRAI